MPKKPEAASKRDAKPPTAAKEARELAKSLRQHAPAEAQGPMLTILRTLREVVENGDWQALREADGPLQWAHQYGLENPTPFEFEMLERANAAWAHESSRDVASTDAKLARVVSHVLFALHDAASAGDLDGLIAREGPDRWAHRYLKDRDPAPRRADAARRFVRWIGNELKKRDAAQPPLSVHAEASRFADRALGILCASELPSCMSRAVIDTPELLERVATEVIKVAVRNANKRVNAEAFARAVLMGWGLTRRQAEDALKLA